MPSTGRERAAAVRERAGVLRAWAGELGERAGALLVRRVRPWVRSRALVRRALYDSHNAAGFSSLYEHEKMLADSTRVDTYQAAIARHVGPDDVVLDLGTGTGVLAMLAARQGARRVYAIDHAPIVEVAEALARHNGIDTITFEQVNSRSYTPPEKVDVIVHEQIGDSLFDENMMVDNLLDLRRRALRPGGRILPARFELYVEPVALRSDRRVPFLWENRFHGLDFGIARHDEPPLARHRNPGHHYRWMLLDRSVAHFLTEPAPAVTFDLDTLPGSHHLPRVVEAARPVTRAGGLDGFCVYFRAIFDDEISLTTSPLAPPTSWGTRIFRTPHTPCDAGDELAWRVELTDLTNPGSWSVTSSATPGRRTAGRAAAVPTGATAR
ncbi:MAG TPA: 50S ribosomal protein L11 methyltransferase [Acidimicrobiales bacterium]